MGASFTYIKIRRIIEMPLKTRPIPSEILPVDKRFKKLEGNEFLPQFPCTLYCVGGPGSGKSSYIYSLLNDWTRNYFDELLIFCPTKDSWSTWSKIKQRDVYVGLWNEKKLEEYIDDLEEEQLERRREGKPLIRACVLLDDLAGYNLSKNGKTTLVDRISLNLRHWNLTLIISSQRYKLFSPTMRNAIHYIVCYRIPRNDFNKLSEEFADPLTPEQFQETFFPHIQKKHEYLFIDIRAAPERRFRLAIDRPIKVRIPDGL